MTNSENPKSRPENLTVNKDTFKYLDKDIQKQGEAFIKTIKNEKDKTTITNTFNSSSPAILTSITTLLENKTTLIPQELQSYKDMKQAFETDSKTLNTNTLNTNTLQTQLNILGILIDLHQINQIQDTKRLEELKTFATEKKTAKDITIKKTEKIGSESDIVTDETEHKKRDAVITKIDAQIKTIETQNQKKAIDLLNKNYETQEQVQKGIFEGNKQGFDTIVKILYGNATDRKSLPSNPSSNEEKRFIQLLHLYIGDDTISGIQIGQGEKLGEGADPRFTTTKERVISYTQNKEPKYVVRGTNKDLQTIAADTNNIEKFDNREENWLQIFDDRGNYVSFQRYITNEGVDYVQKNMSTIIENIKTYSPKEDSRDFKDWHINDLKNGYADVLTTYVLQNPQLLPLYCDYLTPSNSNILGVDKATQEKNFNKILDNPQAKKVIEGLSQEKKQAILNLRATIINQKQVTLAEGIKSMGNMIISLMMLFGMGKWSLKKRLPESMRKEIEEIYNNEFTLDPKKKAAIKEYLQTQKLSKDPLRENTKRPASPDEIKSKNSIQTIATKDYQHLDPKVLEKWIINYKKDNPTIKINESDFIITQNGQKTINTKGIQQNPETNKILTAIINNQETRTAIYQADQRIYKTTTTDKWQEYSEYCEPKDQRFNHIIKNQEDIANYLLSYLFAGSKDLSYTITTNNVSKEINKSQTYVIKNPILADSTLALDEKTKGTEDISWTVTSVIYPTSNKEVRKIIKDKEYILITHNDKQIYIPAEGLLSKEEEKENTQKKYNENNEKITTELEKITTSKSKLDFEKFTYNEKATGDQAEYQTNILTPMQDILNDEGQYNLWCKDISDAEGNIQKWIIHIIKNAFLMMDNTNSPKQYEDLTNHIKEWARITAKNNIITITQDTTWVITVEYKNGKLTTKREAKQN